MKAYADDLVNNPSTTVDTTTALVVTVLDSPPHATAVVDPNDNRAVLITATSPGSVSVQVDESPSLGSTRSVLLQCQVLAPHVPNSRIDFLTADLP